MFSFSALVCFAFHSFNTSGSDEEDATHSPVDSAFESRAPAQIRPSLARVSWADLAEEAWRPGAVFHRRDHALLLSVMLRGLFLATVVTVTTIYSLP